MTKEKKTQKPSYISRGNVIDDLGFPQEQAEALKLKVQLHGEIMKVIKSRKLTSRQIEKIIDSPQPRVSELLNGKIGQVSSDKLAQYLYLLGRRIVIKTVQVPMGGTVAA